MIVEQQIKTSCVSADIINGHQETPQTMNSLKNKIRDIADFPEPGIVFKDITPLVQDPATLRECIDALISPFLHSRVNAVAGMEARGFIFGSLAAWELGVGFIPLRKPGKLPYDVQKVDYALEYGHASLEAHIDAIEPGDKILLIDDVLATGGTAKASCELVEKLGGQVVACAFVMELGFLDGRKKLQDYPLHSLITY
jgi:adenine phosphoribosyltransferase